MTPFKHLLRQDRKLSVVARRDHYIRIFGGENLIWDDRWVLRAPPGGFLTADKVVGRDIRQRGDLRFEETAFYSTSGSRAFPFIQCRKHSTVGVMAGDDVCDSNADLRVKGDLSWARSSHLDRSAVSFTCNVHKTSFGFDGDVIPGKLCIWTCRTVP